MALSAANVPCYDSPLWAGILALTTYFACMSVFGTLIPFFIDDVLDAPKMWIGIAFTSYNVCATIGLFATGMLSDVLGLRRTVILVCIYNVVLLNLQGWVRSVGVLVLVHALLGFGTPYALGLTWVARLVPGPRLARWMAWAVCAAQLSLMTGGLLAGAFQGVDLGLVCAILSTVPAISGLVLLFARDLPSPNGHAAAAGSDPQHPMRAGFFRAMRTRYFLCVSFAPFVQGCYMVSGSGSGGGGCCGGSCCCSCKLRTGPNANLS